MKARPILFPILAGLFTGTSYIPFPPWAILFCFAPLLVVWFETARAADPASYRQTIKTVFFYGWLTQFILNLIGFHWIAYTAVEFGHFPIWAGTLVLLAFAALAHLYIPLSGVIATALIFALKKRGRANALQQPWLFIAIATSVFATISNVTIVDALWPSIFPWHLGYTWLWAGLPGAQTADLIGFEGLNLITLLANALIAIGWLKARESKSLRPSYPWVASAIALFLVVNVGGLGRDKKWKGGDRTANFIAVQGNIGNFEKLIAEKNKDFAQPIVQKYVELTARAFAEHPEATFAIWPETAFADFLDSMFDGQYNSIILRNFVQIQKRSVLTGAYSYSPERKQTFNGFFAIGPDGTQLTPPYRKSILIPFGEKFPFSDVIPYMKWLFPGLGSFGQGPGPSVMALPEFKLGPQICLESLYPEFAAKTARDGAEILSNVTNDSWFGRTFEPYQHMIMTAARAVENRRPLIRSTNTGITTVIRADGQLLEQSPIDKEWYGFYRLSFQSIPEIAVYSRIAGYSAWLALILTLIFLILASRRDVLQSPKS